MLYKLVSIDSVKSKIHLVRGQRVILDAYLAELYGVTVGRLMEQVKRNNERFPSDFVFQLNNQELEVLRSQFAISKRKEGRGGRRYMPYAFTEHGAVMAANVLRSKRAVKASIFVVRAFVKLRQFLASHKELADKLAELERQVGTHDKAIVSLFEAIRKLMTPPPSRARRIGFELEKQQT